MKKYQCALFFCVNLYILEKNRGYFFVIMQDRVQEPSSRKRRMTDTKRFRKDGYDSAFTDRLYIYRQVLYEKIDFMKMRRAKSGRKILYACNGT